MQMTDLMGTRVRVETGNEQDETYYGTVRAFYVDRFSPDGGKAMASSPVLVVEDEQTHRLCTTPAGCCYTDAHRTPAKEPTPLPGPSTGVSAGSPSARR